MKLSRDPKAQFLIKKFVHLTVFDGTPILLRFKGICKI